jgi:hypothetical protein
MKFNLLPFSNYNVRMYIFYKKNRNAIGTLWRHTGCATLNCIHDEVPSFSPRCVQLFIKRPFHTAFQAVKPRLWAFSFTTFHCTGSSGVYHARCQSERLAGRNVVACHGISFRTEHESPCRIGNFSGTAERRTVLHKTCRHCCQL